MKNYNLHLIKNVPNNFITRWIVKKANERMAKAESIYRLRIWYRKAKKGRASYWGDVSKANAKQFSLYLTTVNNVANINLRKNCVGIVKVGGMEIRWKRHI